MRLVRFLMIIGVTLVLLSYISPIVEPSYSTYYNLNPGEFRGYVVSCDSGFDIQISSWFNESFSVYFMTYENGLKTLEEGSLENVTVMQVFPDTTLLDVHISVPNPGRYVVLVTPLYNESIASFEVDFGKQIPNQGLVLVGSSFLFVGILWQILSSRYRK